MKDFNSVTSSHYSDESGKSYFEWQNNFGARNGAINARKFNKYIDPKAVILDFGCGSGYLLHNLSAKSKIGIEINEFAITQAEKKGITIIRDITEIQSESVDHIISNHALEHVPFPLHSLMEIHRILRPGGKLSICLPIDDWRHQKVFRELEINNHLHTWTPQLIGNLLAEAGFDPAALQISILNQSWFRGTKYIWKYEKIFNFLCWVHANITRNGRQIFVHTTKN
jgi:SAM-dependent methyltransferase